MIEAAFGRKMVVGGKGGRGIEQDGVDGLEGDHFGEREKDVREEDGGEG